MKKLLILFLALIALAMLGWYAIYTLKAPAIQADIQKRSLEALASNNLDWVAVNVDGRDVALSGMAQTEQLKQYAQETANVYGIRQLSNNILVQAESVANVEQPETKSEVAGETKSADKAEEVDESVAKHEEQPGEVAQQVTGANDKTADVAVDPSEVKANAIPYRMNIARDDAGVYQFDGVVPDTEFKQSVDAHMMTIGADPAKAHWQVDMSSEKVPENWQKNTLSALSALQALQEGSVSFDGDKALIKGVALNQDISDRAEAFAQDLAGDFTVTDIAFEIATPKVAAKPIEVTPMVGSAKYIQKFCQTEFNSLLRKEKIQFESGSTVLQNNSLELLSKVVRVAARCPDHQIQIHGYTDSQGSAATNKKLSKVRAEAVLSFLVGLGLNKKRLQAIGHGEARPIASNRTEKGRARNRRIELIVKGLKK